MESITYIAAFAAGAASFLSPCVLPVIPTYVAYLAGVTATTTLDQDKKAYLAINSCSFLLGFIVVFVLMGASASYVGQSFAEHQEIIRKLGAIFMFMMGFKLLGVIRLGLLEREYRLLEFNSTFDGPVGAFILGIAFTTGWTPCVGPILSTILVYAATGATVQQGALLLFVYSVGFCLPFIIIALLFTKVSPFLRSIYKWMSCIQRIAGIMLIVASVIIYYDLMQRILALLSF